MVGLLCLLPVTVPDDRNDSQETEESVETGVPLLHPLLPVLQLLQVLQPLLRPKRPCPFLGVVLKFPLGLLRLTEMLLLSQTLPSPDDHGLPRQPYPHLPVG